MRFTIGKDLHKPRFKYNFSKYVAYQTFITSALNLARFKAELKFGSFHSQKSSKIYTIDLSLTKIKRQIDFSFQIT